MRLLVSTLVLLSAVNVIKAAEVIGGNPTVVQGGTVILPCRLIGTTETITQISWRKKPQTDNFLTVLPNTEPKFVNGPMEGFEFIGNIKDKNGSMQVSNVTLMVEGTYTCLFTLFPSGNVKTDVILTVLVPPVISLEDNHPTLGNEEVSLVTCVAAGSKPHAEVTWITDALAEKVRDTTTSTQHANGTTTTVSTLFGVPTREINHREVQCVVNSEAMLKEESRSFTIQVYFPPAEVIILERSEGSFECVAKANPEAKFSWRTNQPWPQSGVSTDGAKLHFLSITSDHNGLYQCEANNIYGTTSGYIYVYVTSGSCPACWTLYILLLLLSAFGVIAVVYLYKSGKFLRTGEETRGERTVVATSGSADEDEVEGRL